MATAAARPARLTALSLLLTAHPGRNPDTHTHTSRDRYRIFTRPSPPTARGRPSGVPPLGLDTPLMRPCSRCSDGSGSPPIRSGCGSRGSSGAADGCTRLRFRWRMTSRASRRVPNLRRWGSSFFKVARNGSAGALSQHTPVRPTDWDTPRSTHSSPKVSDVYWVPRSEWNTTPVTFPPRVAAASSRAAQGRLGPQMIRHRQPEDATGGQVGDERQIQEPLPGGDAGRYPHPR